MNVSNVDAEFVSVDMSKREYASRRGRDRLIMQQRIRLEDRRPVGRPTYRRQDGSLWGCMDGVSLVRYENVRNSWSD
jgi:hypothetical protein